MAIHYKNLNGKTLTFDEIRLLDHDHCSGYRAYEDILKIGICEAIGSRPRQEDRVAFDSPPFLENTTKKQKETIFDCTFKTLQQNYASSYPSVGSTAIVCVIEKHQITTCWLGDSISLLALFDEDNHLVVFKHLNQNLHHPDPHTAEGQRAITIAAKNQMSLPYEDLPGFWRLGNGLALSRAMGDIDSQAYGLNHELEFNESVYQIPTNGSGFVITACDGLTEGMSMRELQEFLNQQEILEPEVLAKRLVDKGCCMDNISVMVAALDTYLPLRILALFDGHNGSYLSQTLSKNFFSTLKHCAQKQ